MGETESETATRRESFWDRVGAAVPLLGLVHLLMQIHVGLGLRPGLLDERGPAPLRSSQLARSGYGITVGIFGIILIAVGILVIVVYGGFYNVPDATYVFLFVGVLLIILGLVEDTFAAEGKLGKAKRD
jgi:hypothetical protein